MNTTMRDVARIPITPLMRNDANRLASLRNDTKSQSQNRSTGKHSDVDNHIIGALGELAFEELTGLPVDWTQQKRGDNGIDFRLKSLGIDVKTREWKGREPDLAVYDPHPWDVTADFLVLCVIDAHEALFLGWTTKYRFIYSGRQLQFGKETRWGVNPESLYTTKMLRKIIDKCEKIP